MREEKSSKRSSESGEEKGGRERKEKGDGNKSVNITSHITVYLVSR